VNLEQKDVEEIVRRTVEETLTSLGVEHDSPLEMQKDFQHLREWRRSTESVKSKGLLAAFGFLFAGLLGALVIGIKDLLHG